MRCCLFALLAVTLLAAPDAWAHPIIDNAMEVVVHRHRIHVRAKISLAQVDVANRIASDEALGSGPIELCADPTPQCRDGNRTGILVQYTKGGKDYDSKVLARVSFDADFGL